MQVDVMKYEEKGFNDVMGILMQELIWEQKIAQIEKKLGFSEIGGDFVVGISCSAVWVGGHGKVG